MPIIPVCTSVCTKTDDGRNEDLSELVAIIAQLSQSERDTLAKLLRQGDEAS